MKIVFMGTPDFAVPCLERLVSDGNSVELVFTREDKPVGRKQILTPPPVKQKAIELGIDVYQPKSLKNNEEALDILKKINPDLIVVVAYGRILPKEILDLPKYGCVNVHGSILPKLRGSSPIQWAIVSGEKETGVTTMLMDEGIDTGDMLEVAKLQISDKETAKTLHDRMAVLGADLLSSTVKGLKEDKITPKKQPQDGATYAPMLNKKMGMLDFSKSAYSLDCLIRGFTPWPLAYFYYNARRFKVLSAEPTNNFFSDDVGIYYEKNGEIYISCSNNTALKILEICPDGSKKMNASAFINGRFIKSGSKLDLEETN